MQDVYHSPWEAYPFLSEPARDLRCDFELMTDELASLTGLLRSLIGTQQEKLRAELLWICGLLYHFNPALRTDFHITEAEIGQLKTRVSQMEKSVSVSGFVLPVGSTAACTAHLLRVGCKNLVRLLYKNFEDSGRMMPAAVDFASLLSSYFFFLALMLNKEAGERELPFASRIY